MAELGSYLENPQINNELCRVAAEFYADCLRTKSTKSLTRKSTTTHSKLIELYESARETNDFTEDNIKKFEDRLMVLLIRNYPFERRIKKTYVLPDIIKEAANFSGFVLTREQLPNHVQMTVNGFQIQLLPLGEPEKIHQSYSIVYDNESQTWK